MKFSDSIFRSILELRAKNHVQLVNRIQASSDTVLIIATLFLGDLFMLAPFIASLRKSNPKVKIILVCRNELKEMASILEVEHVIPSLKPTRASIKKINTLSGNNIDTAYCVFSGRWLPAMIDIPVRRVVSFPEPANRWNHLITQTVDFPVVAMPAIKIPLLMLDKECINEDLVAFDKWSPVGETAIIHVGARSEARRMPIDLVAYIVNILDRFGVNIVISAGPDEFNNYKNLISLIPINTFNRIIFELGSKSLYELVPTIISANIVVGIDTGVLHLSKALGVPTLVLMGQSQIELFGGDNHYSRSIHLGVGNLTCRDKKTFQGLSQNWINRCDRSNCPIEGVPCLGNMSRNLIDSSIHELLKLSLNIAPS